MEKARYILLILALVCSGCGSQGLLSKTLWPSPEINDRAGFTYGKFPNGDYVVIPKVGVNHAEVAYFDYACIYEDLVQRYDSSGVDISPVPVATDTLRTDCKSVLEVRIEAVNNIATRHEKRSELFWYVPIQEWMNRKRKSKR